MASTLRHKTGDKRRKKGKSVLVWISTEKGLESTDVQQKVRNVYRFAAPPPGYVLCTDRLLSSKEATRHLKIFPRRCHDVHIHHSCIGCEEKRIGKGTRIVSVRWGYVRLLVLGVGKDALGLESSPGLLKSPCLDAGE
jgi:hypothetical protein